jgi:nitrilase
MSSQPSTVRVAVVQTSSVLFDHQATVDKASQLIHEAGENGAQLVLFPEALIPGYPRGLSFGMVVGSRTKEGREIWQQYWENAVEIPSPATEALGEAAQAAGIHLAIGVIERDAQEGAGTLYCTLLYFDLHGNISGKHRKLKPTGSERLIWGEGDGSSLIVLPTELGKIGGLICWENYMPLARMAMYSKGVQIYLAPTADQRDTWQATMRHIACEGRCFVLGCNQYVTKDMYPQNLQDHPELANQPEVMCRGGSVIISPLGEVITGPLYNQEGVLYADLEMDEIIRAKVDFDVVGHYARPDVFQLQINEYPNLPVIKKPAVFDETN